MIYFLFFLIGLGAVAYVGAPFRKRHAPEPLGEALDRVNRQTLSERRDNLLRQLKELDFDRKMGKTEGEEYSLLREELSQETALVLQQLEIAEPIGHDLSNALGQAPMSTHAPPEVINSPLSSFDNAALVASQNIDLELEVEVLVARAKFKQRDSSPISATHAARDNALSAGAETVFCTACGRRMNREDRFCARCGQPRAASAPLSPA